MIQKFISQFCDLKIDNVREIGRGSYLIDKDINEYLDKIYLDPESAGVFLGEKKKGKFYPSIALLDIISGKTDKKLIVDGRAEWLYLCGRDMMASSVKESNVKKGPVLVMNERDELLGLGEITGDVRSKGNGIVVKNVLDRGDFLRRER